MLEVDDRQRDERGREHQVRRQHPRIVVPNGQPDEQRDRDRREQRRADSVEVAAAPRRSAAPAAGTPVDDDLEAEPDEEAGPGADRHDRARSRVGRRPRPA